MADKRCCQSLILLLQGDARLDVVGQEREYLLGVLKAVSAWRVSMMEIGCWKEGKDCGGRIVRFGKVTEMEGRW